MMEVLSFLASPRHRSSGLQLIFDSIGLFQRQDPEPETGLRFDTSVSAFCLA